MELRLYLLGILIIGTPAFGMEALILGMRGKFTLTRDKWSELLKIILPSGFAVVIISLGIWVLMDLKLIYLGTFLLMLTFCVGGIISLVDNEKLNKKDSQNQEISSEDEIKSMLKKRGFDQLIKEKKKNKESSDS